MGSYSLVITKSAEKDLASIDNRKDRQRIDHRILRLADDPRPPGCKKLEGDDELYRVRQGEYRIVYAIEDAVRIVSIIRVRHRRDVYRRA